MEKVADRKRVAADEFASFSVDLQKVNIQSSIYMYLPVHAHCT